jgi:DNA-binding transcriptional regulator YiaG
MNKKQIEQKVINRIMEIKSNKMIFTQSRKALFPRESAWILMTKQDAKDYDENKEDGEFEAMVDNDLVESPISHGEIGIFKHDGADKPKFLRLKIQDSFGEEIKRLRKTAGLTQEQVFKKMGIPKRTLQDWENGRMKPPEYNMKAVIRLLKEFIQKNKTKE